MNNLRAAARLLATGFSLALMSSCQEPVLNLNQQDLSQPGATESPANRPDAADAAQLAGIVSDQLSGALLNDAQIRVDTTGVRSDAAGFYLFESLPVGEAKLIVQHPGYRPHTRTLQLSAGRQTVDIALLPVGADMPVPAPDSPATSIPAPQPGASPAPIILNPDGSTSMPSSAPTATPPVSPIASPSAAPSASPTATASPSANPDNSPYDPELDRVAQAEAIVKSHPNGLQLQFLLSRSNGLPVNWGWGEVKVEYYLANLEPDDSLGQFLTSGSSVLLSNGDGFVLSNLSQSPNSRIRINFTLTLPDQRKISQEQSLTVN